MAARVSRGCLPCRIRRVKCDQSRPSCIRCINRDEICTGYRDEATLLFRSENEKAARRAAPRRASFESLRSAGGKSSGSSKGGSKSPVANSEDLISGGLGSEAKGKGREKDGGELTLEDMAGLTLANPFPWAKSVPETAMPSLEDQAISQFFEKYVMYPCNLGSTPGFLEHLPSLFKDVKLEGRFALRWAVRAAAYAGMSSNEGGTKMGDKALLCYGRALTSLGEALKDKEMAVDDSTLMTVVVLDLFESVYLQDHVSLGSHAGGMAQILRLRGPDQIYGARGWSLFRLSHHRLQKQQLAMKKPPLPEAEAWLESLNDELPYIRIEKDNHQISKTSERARNLLKSIVDDENSADSIIQMIREMHDLDLVSATWRAGPGWAYRTVQRSELNQHHLLSPQYPKFVQLHTDVWIAYEWNYYRTGRILLHKQLLECLTRLETMSSATLLLSTIQSFKEVSISVIRSLVDEILSTVPQSLGDIDREGKPLGNLPGTTICKGIGGYFLLWPIRVIKDSPIMSLEQSAAARTVFERIRDCTGMKTTLGEVSAV